MQSPLPQDQRRGTHLALIATAVLLAMLAPAVTASYRAGDAPLTDYPIFIRLFVSNDHVQALAMLGALALALAIPALRSVAVQLAESAGRRPRITVLLAFILMSVGTLVVSHGEPFSMDEYAAQVQAHAFASGHLTTSFPPEWLDRVIWRPFQNYFLAVNRQTGEVASSYWPGLALLMAPFAALHMTWVVNPALTAVALWLIGDLASKVSGQARAAGWAMLLALASPQFLVMGMSYYAMPGLLALNLVYVRLLLCWKPGHAFAAGAVGGLALVLHNPIPHLLLAGPALLWLAWAPERRRYLAPLLAGYLPLSLLLGLGWPQVLSGLSEPSAAQVSSATRVLEGGWAQVRSLLRWPDTYMLAARWAALWKTWIWAAPGLLLMARAAFHHRRLPGLGLLAATFLLTLVFYLFVPVDQGHGWGYRYIHPAWGLLPIAAGVWIVLAAGDAQRVGAAAAIAGLLAMPVFLSQTERTVSAELAKRIEPPGPGHWVVFVAPQGRYTMDRVQNLPGSQRELTLVSDGPASDQAFMAQHFPGAQAVLKDGRGSLWRLPGPAR